MDVRDQRTSFGVDELVLRIALGGGVLLTWMGMSTPWFAVGEVIDGYRLIGAKTAPASGVLIALQVVLSLAPLLPRTLCRPVALGVVAGVAVASALGITMVVGIAFADELAPNHELSDVTFGLGLPILVLGLSATVVAASGWFATRLHHSTS